MDINTPYSGRRAHRPPTASPRQPPAPDGGHGHGGAHARTHARTHVPFSCTSSWSRQLCMQRTILSTPSKSSIVVAAAAAMMLAAR